MFNFKIVEGRNKNKDRFEIFFICYFFILLSISILAGKYLDWDNVSWFLFLGRLLFVILFIILIIIEISEKWVWSVNRVSRKMRISSYRNSFASLSDSHIVTQYEPPKWVNSAEAWLLLHRYASSMDYFSLLYLWSSKWIITIKSDIIDWKEYIILNRINDLPLHTPLYQLLFFNNLFHETSECRLNELSEIHNYYDLFDLEKYWVSKWWFKDNKLLWFRLPSWGIAIVFYFFIFIFFLVFWFFFSIKCLLWFIVSYYLYKKFRRLKRTDKWDKLVEHLLWFRKFVLSCDEKKFESFLKEDPLYYDEILSYAVVFWIETDLMKKLIPVLDEDIVPEDWTYWTWNKLGKFKS